MQRVEMQKRRPCCAPHSARRCVVGSLGHPAGTPIPKHPQRTSLNCFASIYRCQKLFSGAFVRAARRQGPSEKQRAPVSRQHQEERSGRGARERRSLLLLECTQGDYHFSVSSNVRTSPLLPIYRLFLSACSAFLFCLTSSEDLEGGCMLIRLQQHWEDTGQHCPSSETREKRRGEREGCRHARPLGPWGRGKG